MTLLDATMNTDVISITPTDDVTSRRDLPLIIVPENTRNYLNE
jgi:hypothetical protein